MSHIIWQFLIPIDTLFYIVVKKPLIPPLVIYGRPFQFKTGTYFYKKILCLTN